jgi:two-component system sensor histidine kinase MprB
VSFERRLSLATAAAVAVAVLLAAASSYFIVRHELSSSVDNSLRNELAVARNFLARKRLHFTFGSFPTTHVQRIDRLLAESPARFGEVELLQAFSAAGKVQRAHVVSASQALPVTAALLAIARTGKGTSTFTTRRAGSELRVLAAGIWPGEAIVLARPLAEENSTLGHLRRILIVVVAIGIALAALLGLLVARTTLAPVRRLTAAAEHVAATTDLGERIEDSRRDELGRLARSFNAMLAALDESARNQRRLIADASHELRTPVTSLRTNIEYLQRAPDLAEPERARLIGDVVGQLEGLSSLVSDLIELAREDEPVSAEALEEVRFDILVSEAIERVRLYAPQARFESELEETLVSAVPARLGRAVNNLLDNAVKYAGTEQPIEVRLKDGELEVRDHGPGIEPDELEHVFDRFFRGSRSRSLPGSGLGLAIVRQVAERHGGSVRASAAPGGGLVVALALPVLKA